jgi:hypothetical protein
MTLVNIASNDNKVAYGIKHFNLDVLADLDSIKKSALTPGSTAFIIETSQYYMLNGSHEWKEVSLFGSSLTPGGGGGDTPPEDEHINYDGGSIDDSDPT